MSDLDITHRINALSTEEEALYERAGDGQGISTADHERLASIQVELDRCYDLLRQRQARRAAGLDPASAEVRPAEIVEHYEQ